MQKIDKFFNVNENENGVCRVVKLDKNSHPMILLSNECEEVWLHWLDEIGWARCLKNKKRDCVLCEIGNDRKQKLLFPVFSILREEMMALSVDSSKKAGALLPQVYLAAQKAPIGLRIKKIEYSYAVETFTAKGNYDEKVADNFLKKIEAGEIDLRKVYPLHKNSFLRNLDSVFRLVEINYENDPDAGSNDEVA